MSSSTETQTTSADPHAAGLSPAALVIFTPAAVRKVIGFTENSPEAEGKSLRLYVQGGGCSGFEYGFKFDEPKEGDSVIPQGHDEERIEVLIDSFSLPFLQGCTVDYYENFAGSGFKVSNPNAQGTCGCGHSFST
jgi:iron-sulfur cluster assembly accessory protein